MEGHRPGDVESRRQLPQDHVAQNLGAVVVVFARVLHEAETVHVANDALAVRPADSSYHQKTRREHFNVVNFIPQFFPTNLVPQKLF